MRRSGDRRPMEIGAWFTPAAAATLRDAIAEADGREVFCVGNCDTGGLVRTVTIAARGNDREVPVLAPYVDGADLLIHNHPSGLLQPSGADLSVAGWVGDQGKGFCIVDNAVTRIYVVAEPAPRRERRPLDTRALAATLRAGGALHRLHPGFEQRSGQVSLLQAACDAFNDEVIVAAEAGTGIGKSLAYLIPAVAWADANDERVVVSTATINLQQQLMAQDLPLVQRMLGTEVKSCLVKGRGNYLCLRRLREAYADAQGLPAAAAEGALDAHAAAEVRAIYEWSLVSPTGSRSDLPFATAGAAWDLVCSEGDACNALRCPDREACFVLRARREAAAARLLVVNHHLLFADLAIRLAGGGGREALASAAVLPGFRRIVFDEAHAIESNAASFFSQRLARTGLERLAGRLVSARHGARHGLVPRRADWFIGAGRDLGSVVAQVEELRRLAGRLERAAARQLVGEPAAVLDVAGDRGLAEALEATGATLASLAGAVSAALDAAEPADRDDADAVELRIQARRMRAAAQLCERLSTVPAPADGHLAGNAVRWVEGFRRRDGTAAARLVVTPVEVAPLMRAAIFDRYPSVVLTSATLTVAGDFGFWCGRVGLAEVTSRPVFTEQYPSPFAYREQALAGIPIDAPEPTAAEHQAWLGRYLVAVLRASRGRALVLFTSYAMLDRSFRQVQEPLAAAGITVLRQGDDDRHRLLDRFRGDTASVLLATDSFWEGIDAPGEALSLVVICRLPFSVPSHPVAAAQMARVAQSGADPFLALTLPRAVMRVRQGFGRLIRRHDDRGVVLFLDVRLARKSYGAEFLRSLPDVRLETAPGAELVDRVREYLGFNRTSGGTAGEDPSGQKKSPSR
ncbi:MAG: helicase-related protein [Spirochaetaceae bacterium]|nr:helicase-related protein [Spirochaetaceae bacterium]